MGDFHFYQLSFQFIHHEFDTLQCNLYSSVFILYDQPCSLSILSIQAGPSNETSVVESKDRKANAHLILKLMCDSVVLRPHLRELLSAKYVNF